MNGSSTDRPLRMGSFDHKRQALLTTEWARPVPRDEGSTMTQSSSTIPGRLPISAMAWNNPSASMKRRATPSGGSDSSRLGRRTEFSRESIRWTQAEPLDRSGIHSHQVID